MGSVLKRVAARLPGRWQQQLKRLYFSSKIKRGRFRSDESEFELLPLLVSPGDWVLDVGANIGHYTVRMSQLVGAEGRVISFEPVPETFELLAANAALVEPNVTLINAAASDSTCVIGMEIPRFDTGLENFYMARISQDNAALGVMCLAIDSLLLPNRVALIKIDTEGNELSVVKGAVNLLKRDHPVLIIEDNVPQVIPFLTAIGYSDLRIAGSSNRVFCFDGETKSSITKTIGQFS